MTEETLKNSKQLSRIDFTAGRFEANGKIYIIENQFCIDRWIMKEELEMELGFGANYREMMANWENVYDLANNQRFADIAVSAYNAIKGIEKVSQREPLILKFCALFCNTEDEDRTVINEDMITSKINDWKAGGIAIGDFFTLAANTIPTFIENYKKATQ